MYLNICDFIDPFTSTTYRRLKVSLYMHLLNKLLSNLNWFYNNYLQYIEKKTIFSGIGFV